MNTTPRSILRRLFGIVLALTLAAHLGTALAAEAAIPRPPERWVTDSAGLLSAEARQRLDTRLETYERQTGHQIVIWIGTTLGSTPLEDFAVNTFKAWKLGREGVDDGVLVAVLAQDRRIAIEVGYGLEGRVPDAVAARIIRDVMVPRLRASAPDTALTAGVDALLNAIDGKPFVPDADDRAVAPERPNAFEVIVFFALAGAFLLLLITHPALALSLLYVMGGRGGGGGGGGNRGGRFAGGGGRSGGGGARGSW